LFLWPIVPHYLSICDFLSLCGNVMMWNEKYGVCALFPGANALCQSAKLIGK
jgi:hypothetical protein